MRQRAALQDKVACIRELKTIEQLREGAVANVVRAVKIDAFAPTGIVDLIEQQVRSAPSQPPSQPLALKRALQLPRKG